jgi:sialate O-acetylesterase
MSLRFASLAWVLAVAPLGLRALELPNIFSDHMVLQQGQPLPVWGLAASGATVKITFGQQSVEVVADAEGKWLAKLAPESANATPATLQVTSGEKQIAFSDVLVGEVWLCSGQSNMQVKVENSLNGDLFILGGSNPLVRLYQVEIIPSTTPRFSAKAKWTPTDAPNIARFSAVGFHFGTVLQSILGVPVGLVGAYAGGTPAIAWTRPSAFPKHPLLVQHVADWEAGMPTYTERNADYKIRFAAWKKSRGIAPNADIDVWAYADSPKPEPYDPKGTKRPGVLANGMLSTVAPYATRGAIWYQGEADAGWVPERYDERLAVMVEDWRVWWNNPTLAFGVAQLANFKKPVAEPTDEKWAQFRESQRRFVQNVPHSGLAVTIDVGEANDIHPLDKETVGQRLARWALTDIYKKLNLRGGPEPTGADFTDQVLVRFKSTGGGLWAFNGGPLQGFTLAGPDGVFHHAQAELKGKDAVVVRCPEVPAPQAVRYAWAMNPRGANLSNRQRLPAGPFELAKNPRPPTTAANP